MKPLTLIGGLPIPAQLKKKTTRKAREFPP